MRHAEETSDPMNLDLSPAGAIRAHMLADYISATFGTPQILIATALSKHSDPPAETLTPLSQRIGSSIESNFGDKEWAELANDLMVNPRYAGRLTVVCWQVARVMKGRRLEGEDRLTAFIHRRDVVVETARRADRAKLASGIDDDGSVCVCCS